MKKILSVVMVIAMLVALSATAFAAGQGSPVPTTPPMLENKEVTGEGKTADNKVVKVDEWKPEGTVFADAKEATDGALASDAFDDLMEKLGLEEKGLSGTSLLCAEIKGEDPITVVLLYGNDGDPVAGLYYYGDDADGEWYEVEVEKTENGGPDDYTLTLKTNDDGKGLDAELEVTITDKMK